MMELEIQTMQPGERLYAYRQSTQLEGQTGGVGYLRGDFGKDGREFFTTWEDGHGRYKTDAFRQEFDRVVNTLRQPGGLFSGRSEMARICHDHADAGFDGNDCREYGFRINTQQYSYLLRCHTNPGDYNFYLFAYMTEHLDRHMENAGRGIRFITPDYKELFRIPDGDKVRITWSDGERIEHTCRYIDDCHLELGRGMDGIRHICQLAEQLRQNGGTVIPLRSSLPEQCYNLLPSTGGIILVKKGETGFFKTDLPDMGREENRAFVLETNEKLGVSRAQAAAMLAGSMFGWQTQAADPCSYDEQGRMLTPKQRFQKERGEAR